MATRTAKTIWEGDFKKGTGRITSESGALKDISYTFSTRFENEKGSNPEELIASAHSACYSMSLAEELGKAGYRPAQIVTEDKVTIEKTDNSYKITKIEVFSEATVLDDIEHNKFLNVAENAKKNCPVSKALTGTEIVLNATLKTTEPVEFVNGN